MRNGAFATLYNLSVGKSLGQLLNVQAFEHRNASVEGDHRAR